MRKTFSLAFAKRRTELRFVIYDLMCCLQKTHSLNSISSCRYLLFIFPIQLPKPPLLLYYYYYYVVAHPNSWNVIKSKSFKFCVSRKKSLSSQNTMHYYSLSPLSRIEPLSLLIPKFKFLILCSRTQKYIYCINRTYVCVYNVSF